jgi:hypothetical protein
MTFAQFPHCRRTYGALSLALAAEDGLEIALDQIA